MGLAKKLSTAVLSPFGLELRRADIGQYPEATPHEEDLLATFGRYSMSPPFRMWTFLKAVEYVDRTGVAGDIVECGVWRGGNMLLAKAACATKRRFWLYDTFSGMTEPTDHDVSIEGRAAKTIHAAKTRDGQTDWANASLQEVLDNFQRHDLLDDYVVSREGRVEDTLHSDQLPEKIAILRLDTDWYESTLVELQVLYPLLQPGGILIIDDYGAWLGSKKAVDEYFDGSPPFLMPVDRSCRMAIKV